MVQRAASLMPSITPRAKLMKRKFKRQQMTALAQDEGCGPMLGATHI
eukprot:CAMPEP_0194482740 /NCGR_PEP_ID=MMETSP0253-20130528/4548_1 /TAXON_ID=2966 /ORGANISM="Noctiluca scintillans" /LENGTH=46 /DNA_ID= /DNA_START= /DNA_END= /DNA_ORIENTATION=